MTAPATANDLGKQARARFATADNSNIPPYATGRIIGYCDSPQVLIYTDDGRRVWWRADYTEVDEQR